MQSEKDDSRSSSLQISTFVALTVVCLAIAASANARTEWVTVAKVLDGDGKGIIVRKNGDSFLIEKGVGCLSFW